MFKYVKKILIISLKCISNNYKMTEWHSHFIDLLKFLETQGEPVREFRRSFESGRKQDRIYPTLNEIYEKCKDKLEENFVEEFNSQNFRVSAGLKTIVLKCNGDKELFEQYLRQLFSYWNSEIQFSVPNKASKQTPIISKKKISKAMKHLNSMSTKQLKNTAASASKSEMSELAANPEIHTLAEQLQENPTAKKLARKLDSGK